MTTETKREGHDVSGPAGTWSAALDALEADVETLDRALHDGTALAVASWQPPRDLGPVPDSLVTRAERLVARIAEVRGRGQQRLTQLHEDLGELDRRRDAGAAYSSAGRGAIGSH